MDARSRSTSRAAPRQVKGSAPRKAAGSAPRKANSSAPREAIEPALRRKRARTAGRVAERPALDMGPLGGLLGYLLRRAQLAVFEDFIEAFAPLRLRPAQFSALIVIDRNPGCSQAEIAEALGIARPNFVAMMDELERRGLAARALSRVDRRTHALMLTDAGRRLLKRALQVVAKHEARVCGTLSAAERETMVRLLHRLVGAPAPALKAAKPKD